MAAAKRKRIRAARRHPVSPKTYRHSEQPPRARRAGARQRPCGPESVSSFRVAPRARRAGASSRNLKDGKRKSRKRDPSAAPPCGRLCFRARGALVRPHARGRSRKNLSSPKTSVSLTKNRRRLRRDFCEWRRSRARKRAARPHRRAARNRPRAKPQAGRRSARANSRGHSPRRLGSSSLHHEKTRHKCTLEMISIGRNPASGVPSAGLRSARANSRGHSPRRLGSSSLHHEKTRHKCTVFFRGGTESRKNAHSIISDKQNRILLPSRFTAFGLSAIRQTKNLN